jgi:regulator of sigma E protease
MTIVFAILLFSVLIVIHELGHFVSAKMSGVQVNEFSIFLGPALVKWKRGETQYAIRCIPFGGYCAMEGEDEETDNPRSFQKAAWWKRLIILVAGSAMNFIAGLLLVAIVLSCQPGYTTTQVGKVESWSSLNTAGGLESGDRIVEINGKKIDIYQDFYMQTLFLEDGNYQIVVERDGQKVTLDNVPMVRQKVTDVQGNEQMLYGLQFNTSETTAGSVAKMVWPTATYNVDVVIASLKMLVTGQAGLKDMTGPVGIVKIMSESASAAPSAVWALISLLDIGAFIAINLAVMNMLPIPALDGGRVVALLLTTAIEKITKKKINPKYEGYVHAIGMILLLGLMAFVLFQDLFMIFKR